MLIILMMQRSKIYAPDGYAFYLIKKILCSNFVGDTI